MLYKENEKKFIYIDEKIFITTYKFRSIDAFRQNT